ncbi:glycosyltransferase family 58 protein [Phaffia rhodozyma]|uniref:Dol-P-Man:Man(5)GlcNAc(2)-PP-Dol alpha-1,3-mannosyltransferase n=1 Tax=Phaffia rhodozyma TaxID=264483 RepID=A0A0F7SHH8_PHARH|nr:glycosyltransferase family 58 protein [Phaffia rhodozyma]
MAPVGLSNPASKHGKEATLRELVGLIRSILTDPACYWYLAGLLAIGELILGGLIIRFVPYTEIDYKAYMEQVGGFLGGERDYSKLEGGTGPLVYPALHLYIYTLLSHLPSHPQALLASLFPPEIHPHLLPQLIFLALYLGQFLLTALVYKKARMPQYALIPLTLSKRAHSIYMLRLFGDPWAVGLVWASIWLFQKSRWNLGTLVFSLALGVKMNILLYIPGLLVLYWKALGPLGMISNAVKIGLVQILLPLPFFLRSHPRQYLTSAFDFSRSFLYKWTVNWRFVPESTFLSREFHVGLMAVQLVVLAGFGWRWCRSEHGGAIGVLRRGLSRRKGNTVGRSIEGREIVAIMFTSNLIGMVFARSLHYQFQSWYFHQIPLLLALTAYPLPIKAVLFAMTEYGWSLYPSSDISSATLIAAHIMVLLGIWINDAEGRAPSLPPSLSQSRAPAITEIKGKKER